MKNFGIIDWIIAAFGLLCFLFGVFVFKHGWSAWIMCGFFASLGWVLKTIFVEPKVTLPLNK